MKSFMIIVMAIATTCAQRPSFAGSGPKGYPELATRFQTNSAGASGSIANRFDGSADDAATTQNLPVDARGDASLVNRLNQWPRDQRPFWLLNAAAIEKQRDPEGVRTGQKNPVISSTNQQNVASFVNRLGIPSDTSVFTNEAGDILVPVEDETELKNIFSKSSAKVFVLVPNTNQQEQRVQNSQNILSRSSISNQSSGYGR